jgi:hypothetical protein
MQKTMIKVAVLAVAAVAVTMSGCATKRYGRMTSMSSAETQYYTCEQLAIEVSKVEQFELEVERGSKIDWKSVAGFLGDYGIGNAMEKNEAVKSAKERKAQLRQQQTAKQCQV